MSLGENLRELRKMKGWKQETLAEAAKVSLTQISKIERDDTDPRVSTVTNLARALDCSMDKLMMGMVSGGLNGKLKEAFERAQLLRPRDKGEIISLIHKYCTASILMTEMIHDYEAESNRLGMDSDQVEFLDQQKHKDLYIETQLDDRKREEMDSLIRDEEDILHYEKRSE